MSVVDSPLHIADTPDTEGGGRIMRAVLFAVVVLGCGKQAEKVEDNPVPANKAPVTGLVDIQELSQDFRNEAKGDEKYTGRQLTALGYMHKLDKLDSGEYVMSFGYFLDGFNWGKGNVCAHFPASESPKLAKYENRSPVYFQGRCDGKRAGEITIRDCKIVPAPLPK
jgi:hypothetical protein